MKKTLIAILFLSACGPFRPDYVDDSGREYTILTQCVESHTKQDYGYHYGYNFMSGKYEYHYGMETETICDRYVLDTVEINKEKRYYSKKRK